MWKLIRKFAYVSTNYNTMKFEQLIDSILVIDKQQAGYGVGRVDTTKDGIVYVWYDEIETMVHYKENDLNLLELFEA